MSSYIQLIAGLKVEKAKAATLATPSVSTDGCSLTTAKASWAPFSGGGWPRAAVGIFADGTGSLSAGARLLGFGPFGDDGIPQWFVIATLNNGAQINLTSTVGYVQEIDLPAVFTALAIDGTINGGINVGYTFTPIAERF